MIDNFVGGMFTLLAIAAFVQSVIQHRNGNTLEAIYSVLWGICFTSIFRSINRHRHEAEMKAISNVKLSNSLGE